MKKPIIISVYIFGVFAIIGIIVFVSIVFFGAYNVAATEKHSKPIEWILSTTMKNSVKRRAKYIGIPDTLDLKNPNFYQQFYGHYSACVTCHAALGKKAEPWMVTLYPPAPDLTKKEFVDKWSDEELYWIIYNGIAETGMIGLGPTHTEKDVWGVTALVRQLPDMTQEEYNKMAEWFNKLQTTKEPKDHSH